MKDQILIELSPGYALGFDNLQWIIYRAYFKLDTARLRPVAFIASTKAVLWRCIHENEIELTHEAVEYIDAMPDAFRAWYRWHKRRGALVPEQEAA